MTNNERFNAILNGCKHPGKVYAALSALTAHEQYAALTPENQRTVDKAVELLVSNQASDKREIGIM